jgi:Uma2 family endonuclease
MVLSNLRHLPSTAELPCSDDTPVDNEDQNLLPNLLLFLLQTLWSDRMDWFFGVDMAVYHTTGVSPKVPVVPDGFLSLGVERRKANQSRRSYAVWEEQDIVPLLALEIVSWTPGGEYTDKLTIYAQLGVLYYVVYNPDYWRRDAQQPFIVYKLIDGTYQAQIGEPYWLPEVGLGIGRCQYGEGQLQREILTWYDATGIRYLTGDERADQERQRADQERQRADQECQRADQERQRADQERQAKERLLDRLKTLGIDPTLLT